MLRSPLASRNLLPLALAAAAFAASGGCADVEPLPPKPGGEIIRAAKAPPSISGGTLAISRDGATAVAADPDRDQVYVVDLANRAVRATIALQAHDEPGRVALDDTGRAFVALRRGGAIAIVDLATASLIQRVDACPAPRGVAVDAAGLVHVACVGGELVSIDSATGTVSRAIRLDHDLRDVIVRGSELLVTRFRSAELLVIADDGTIKSRLVPSALDTGDVFEPAVAWKAIPLAGGGVAMAHQRALAGPIDLTSTEAGSYGTAGRTTMNEFGCDGSIVQSTVTVFEAEEDPFDANSPQGGDEPPSPPTKLPPLRSPTGAAPVLPGTILPVDIAISSDGQSLAVVGAGSNAVHLTSTDQAGSIAMSGTCSTEHESHEVPGGPIAVAYSATVELPIVQTREPAALHFLDGTGSIALSKVSVADTGHDMFHTNPGGAASLACASCHPEGRDDGRTWHFNPIGKRRTQVVNGGILATAPLHWDGDMHGIDTIMREVFVNRMGGAQPGPRKVRAFGEWMDRLPAVAIAPPADADRVARGEMVYAKAGCDACHNGEKLTNNETVDVGTGRALQVPSLRGIVHRAPYMHDGCAKTLRDRFDAKCGGDRHGDVAGLSQAELDDLVAYLEVL